MELLVTESTLDERFVDLRRSVEGEIARARQEVIEHFTKALSRMRSAGSEPEWNAAVVESGRFFMGNPAAIEFLAMLAALTAPRSPAALGSGNLTAQRFARVKVAEIQLYQGSAVKAGRAARDLYGALRPEIDAAREAFRERFLTPGHETGDYLHAELVRELANEDATLLGPEYPGPMA
jgi:hypothetical protein